jgi:2-phospho-L-lactate guanylyltransferase
MSGAIWALVPAKAFGRGKSRLREVLGERERAAFARSMMEHVVRVLRECDEIAGVMTVTDCDEVAAVASSLGAITLRDPARGSLGAIVDGALTELEKLGASAAIVMMADLPRVTNDDATMLARATRELDVVVAPDARDEGTNALGIALTGRLATSFGTFGSFGSHVNRARAAGKLVGVRRSATLAMDIDFPEDYARLIEFARTA